MNKTFKGNIIFKIEQDSDHSGQPIIIFFLKNSILIIILSIFMTSAIKGQFNIIKNDTIIEYSHQSFNLTINNSGIGFGNSEYINGFRFNITDGGIKTINGMNITFWMPEKSPGSKINGIALGLAPYADKLNGISIGLLTTTNGMNGLNVGLFVNISQGDMNGINISGLASVAENNIYGINFGGLILLAQKEITGINFGGLTLIGKEGITGFNFGGLAIVSGNKSLTGISITAGKLFASSSITGIHIAGYNVETENLTGLNVTGGWVKTENLTGISLSPFHKISGLQQGIVIGIVNIAEVLEGLQIGLINIAQNNPVLFRVLPLINYNP